MDDFGLIGKNIDYSFSKTYFKNKFEKEDLNCRYQNFDIDTISKFPEILKNNIHLKGLNVTTPYKETIIPYLTKLNEDAYHIGAVNTIKIIKNGELIGYNTDYFGFKKSIEPLLKKHHKKALILGTGGASKAIIFALKDLNIEYTSVSRQKTDNVDFTYDSLTETSLCENHIIINCTPLGTYPNIDECPNIPYHALTNKHLLYDLVYNPPLSTFLKNGRLKGATIINGLKMLELQAEKSWKIWND